MGIFDNSRSQKNKVYYRRKSIRLNNFALTFASLTALAFTFYLVSQRGESQESGVDEISTSTLFWH